MIEVVLSNIIGNAIKYSKKGGNIIVAAKRSGNMIEIEIKDNGIGIPKDILGKLFSPQITSISETWKNDKEAGIGLLLSKGYVEQMGGKFWEERVKGEAYYFNF